MLARRGWQLSGMRLQLSEGWKWVDLLPSLVIPAKAGTQGGAHCPMRLWAPAFAGVTGAPASGRLLNGGFQRREC